MSDNIKTPLFRVSFPQMFSPKAVNPNDTPKYGLVMLFPKGADLTALKSAAKAAATEKWGTDIPKPLRSPFQNQGEKEYEGYEDGAIFIRASSKQRPGLVDQNLEPVIDESEFYAGCYARASVVAKGYGGKGTSFRPGVTFYLQNVQKVRDGENLTGRTKAEDDFEPIEMENADADNTNTADANSANDLF